MKCLFILNDPPYGTERSYNALRLAGSLVKREGEECSAPSPAAGARRGSMEVLTERTLWADKVLVF